MTTTNPQILAQRQERIGALLRQFKLPTLTRELVPALLAAGHEDALTVVLDVLEAEAADRQDRRVSRLRQASHLPLGKTFATFDDSRLPRELARRLRQLARGEFVERAVNVLAFGLPGTGKTHAACALGHALVEQGVSVGFFATFQLVQELLVAKRELRLSSALRKLDRFEVLMLDDLGYVQQNAEEMEVLFTLLAERYERKSLLLTSNLVFSQWDQIFKNPMTTAAAIDRLVHHSVILEFNVSSFRMTARQQTVVDEVPPHQTVKADASGGEP